MEQNRTVSMINSVPSFAQGLKILLVHNDTLSLANLSSMLEKYSFKVTVTDGAKDAVSMINQQEGKFDLVMAKANMPDMDALSFLHLLHEKDIPIIFISSGEYNNDTKLKALAKGSCYFLEEPVLLEDLKYVWQHVYHKKRIDHNAYCEHKVHETHDDRRCMQKEKRKKILMNSDNNHLNAAMEEDEEEEEEETREHKCHGFPEKRSRIVWTHELHQKFINAIRVLGHKNNIRPKAILQVMNVPDLTARQVSSHLQKYKTIAQISQMARNPRLPLLRQFSSLNDRTRYYSSFQKQGCYPYPGFPASTEALSERQNQNLFQESHIISQMLETPSLFPYELPAAFANNGSQNPEAEVGGQPMPIDASLVNQNQPMTANDTMQILEEDCDQYEFPDQIDEYSEMLKNILLGESSN